MVCKPFAIFIINQTVIINSKNLKHQISLPRWKHILHKFLGSTFCFCQWKNSAWLFGGIIWKKKLKNTDRFMTRMKNKNNTVRKVSVFGIFLVRIQSECGKIRTKKTPLQIRTRSVNAKYLDACKFRVSSCCVTSWAHSRFIESSSATVSGLDNNTPCITRAKSLKLNK